MARVLLLWGLAVLLGGCQLAETTGPVRVTPSGQEQAEPVLGNPARQWPRTLAAAEALARQEALAWQDQPVLADLTVWLSPAGRWERVRLTYVAAGAERLLTYRSRPGEVRVERPLLEGLQLPELPAEAVQALPPLPEDVLEPVDLAAASARALADCEAGDRPVRAVLYSTGAPATWDGQAWTRTPEWRATVVTDRVGVTVDPTDGIAYAPLTCVEPFLLADDG